MAVEIKVPALGESVTEATVAKWLVKAGDSVSVDQPLCELETDKVTVEVNALSAGTIADLAVEEGATVQVGGVLCHIEAGAGGAPAPLSTPKPAATPAPVAAAPKPALIQVAAPAPAMAAAGPAVPAGPRSNADREERVKMTRLRRTIANRLKEAQNTAAMLTTFNEVDMTNVMALRERTKDDFEKKNGARLGFMSFFVKACIAGLKELPAVNAEIEGDDLVYKNYYDIGVAVGTPNGLVVPVLRDADELSFGGI